MFGRKREIERAHDLIENLSSQLNEERRLVAINEHILKNDLAAEIAASRAVQRENEALHLEVARLKDERASATRLAAEAAHAMVKLTDAVTEWRVTG